MEIAFHGQLTEPLLRKATLLAYKPSKKSMVIRITISIIIFIAMAIYAIVTIPGMDQSMDGWLSLLGMEMPGILFIYFCYLPFQNALIMAQGMWKIPQVQDPRSGVFNDRGLTINFGDGINHDYPWTAYFRIVLQGDLIVLVANDGKFDCFPRSFFNSEEDWRKVQEIIRFYVKEPE